MNKVFWFSTDSISSFSQDSTKKERVIRQSDNRIHFIDNNATLFIFHILYNIHKVQKYKKEQFNVSLELFFFVFSI
ncbi:hypothetical protein BACINT_04207 [Bacteroides intestinalis DSM 17393]|jgi:hypothetical protein|uniref:Uncharacterized protein n=2 Tax=Bacteroides intestinalis TaxID=329854 RepID=A0A412P868_9BACE|nr:hypothetical protein BACINT_04207 [Bacteroides intestinalis DSM 17393]RGJ57470.1 hypothetical protein DXD57_06280 [Bacteroides intestinalis]RGT51278.1 hypothetical protein DWX27_12560 [Bacteroides intestinalis]RGX86626.1 hypothetical protein DXA61_04010 [Bacteroides intestinalis]RHE84733.1 hypothetical protein DW715_01520 [Bacteroides intestinalis]